MLPRCAHCKDTGYVTWEKPIGPFDNIIMVPQFSPCIMCEAGAQAMKLLWPELPQSK
jgi:hypothetical protein